MRNNLLCRNRYTLVELVTVTAILLVVLAVGTVRLSAELLDGGPYQKAGQLRRIAALCRRQAVATGKTCAVEFDPVRRRLFFGKEQVTYPQELRILRNGEELLESGVVLRFFPDGGAAETALAFERDGEAATLWISPLTGSIVIDETE